MALKRLLKPVLFTSCLLFFFVLLGIYPTVFSAPEGVVPIQNIIPNFNNLTVTGTATFGGGLTLNAGALSNTSSIRIHSDGGLAVGNSTGVEAFAVNGTDGSLSNPKSNDPVRIQEADGFAIYPDGSSTSLFSISSQGFVSNPSSGEVRVTDPEGFAVVNSVNEEVFVIDGTGGILSPIAGNPVKMSLSGGLHISDNNTTTNFQIGGGYSLKNPSTNFDGRITIKDEDGLQFNDDEGNYRIGIEGDTGNMNTRGWITAQDGIGVYGTRGMYTLVPPGSEAAPSIYCADNQVAVFCGYSTTAPFGSFQIKNMRTTWGAWDSSSGGSCQFNVKNVGSSTYTFNYFAHCFDPGKTVYSF